MVSLTFDDGWLSHSNLVAPALASRGWNATFYLMSGWIGTFPYLSGAQAQALHAAGHEIGGHTITHADLVTLSPSERTRELTQSKADLEALIGAPVTSFASPYGSFNASVLAEISSIYASHRTVFSGLNTPGAVDRHQLLVRNVLSNTTAVQVQGWLAQARTAGAWLILVYHDITATPQTYDSTPADFAAQLDVVAASGLPVVTVSQGLALAGG